MSNKTPFNIFDNIQNLAEPQEISNSFKNYFLNVATDIQSSVRYSKSIFHDFLPLYKINSFFLDPANETEAKNIIMALNTPKAIDPNSIPTKVLKLLIIDVSS